MTIQVTATRLYSVVGWVSRSFKMSVPATLKMSMLKRTFRARDRRFALKVAA